VACYRLGMRTHQVGLRTLGVGMLVALLLSLSTRASAQAAAPVILVPPSVQTGPADAGWAFSAGLVGVIAAAGVVGLSVGAVATDGEPASAYLGLAATGTLAIVLPIVAVGGASARSNPLIQGSRSTRTLGWVGYGLSLTTATALLFVGAAGDDVPVGLIAATGILGAGSLVAFSVEAFNTDADARSPVGQASNNPGFTLQAPALAVLPARGGGVDGLLTFGGSF